MATATGVTLAEYLATDYKPDREYVDGELLERNVGKQRHSRTQIRLGQWFVARETPLFKTLTEQRVQVSATHVRIPDVCLISKDDNDEITERHPLLCVEILSPDDRWSRVQESVDDYLQMGVPAVWVIDPYAGKAWVCSREHGVRPVTDNTLHWNDLAVELRDILPD